MEKLPFFLRFVWSLTQPSRPRSSSSLLLPPPGSSSAQNAVFEWNKAYLSRLRAGAAVGGVGRSLGVLQPFIFNGRYGESESASRTPGLAPADTTWRT